MGEKSRVEKSYILLSRVRTIEHPTFKLQSVEVFMVEKSRVEKFGLKYLGLKYSATFSKR